jgi:hypothetical protein
MYTYCSIIQKIMSPQSNVTFNDEIFYKKNTNDKLKYIKNNL